MVVIIPHPTEELKLIKYQKELIQILQQPPEEYKDRYIACITCEEPSPVTEVDPSLINDDDSGELLIETDSETEKT